MTSIIQNQCRGAAAFSDQVDRVAARIVFWMILFTMIGTVLDSRGKAEY